MNLEKSSFISDSSIIFMWFGVIFLTVVTASLCTLLIESPIIQLEKIIFRKSKNIDLV